MAEMKGVAGELRCVVEIKRKATGKVEKFDMIGKVTGDGGDALDGGPQRRN